jgi:hypothetical protein
MSLRRILEIAQEAIANSEEFQRWAGVENVEEAKERINIADNEELNRREERGSCLFCWKFECKCKKHEITINIEWEEE